MTSGSFLLLWYSRSRMLIVLLYPDALTDVARPRLGRAGFALVFDQQQRLAEPFLKCC